MLVGDRERELTTASLRRHFGRGRLSVAEFSDRIDLALRARSRSELDRALHDLPTVWEDVPALAQTIPRKLQRGARRVRLFFVFALVWCRLTLGLVLVCGIALMAGAPVSTVVGGFLLMWALASFATWHFCRRAVSRGT